MSWVQEYGGGGGGGGGGSGNHNMNQPDRISVVVDRERFIQTRNALTNAFVGLSGAIDEAVKAYVNHTNAVLDGVGGSTLDVSGLMQPFHAIGNVHHIAQLAQQAILQNGNGLVNPDGTRKKRQYKPRDPNAPKRPLTAYFRYLQEQRPIISRELQAQGPQEGKAGDISKIATERWNQLDEKTRKPYRQAYEAELKGYTEAVAAYKAANGQDGDAAAATDADAATSSSSSEDDEDDDSEDEDSSSESSSASEDEEVPARLPPPPAPKPAASPAVVKKASKSAAKKTIKAGADPITPAPAAVQFPSHTPSTSAAPVAPMGSSPSRKRKADGAEGQEKKKDKKRSRKSTADNEAADAAAAAAQLQIDPRLQQTSYPPVVPSVEKPKKEKKKKRKPEAAGDA